MTKRKVKPQRLIWAFDPFRPIQGSTQNIESFLGLLASRENFQIEPTFVLSPDSLNWSGDVVGPWIKKCAMLAEQRAELTLGSLKKIGNILPLHILANSKPSTRKDVALLVKYAKSQKASWIVASSAYRSGLERWVLGSFTETLLFESRLPVMVIKPDMKLPVKFEKVLFPTDLSTASHRAMQVVAKICSSLGAEMILMHKLPEPIEPAVQMGIYQAGGGWIGFEKYIEQTSRNAKTKLASWSKKLTALGVKNSIELIEQSGLLSEAISKLSSSREINMVAISSEASRISSVILGSVARQVLRDSTIPVIVIPRAATQG